VIAALLLSLSVAQWQADINYLKDELPRRHANLFAHISRSEFESALAAIRPGDDAETLIAIQQVVARAGDAHTEVDTRRAGQTYFPLRLYRFDDGIYVTKTSAESRAAWRARLVAIDGMDVGEVYRRVATVISHENDAWIAARFASPMLRADTLHALGVTTFTGHARFTFDLDGRRFDLDLTAGAPLPRDPLEYYWYTYDAERRILFVKYNVCANEPAEPFTLFADGVLAIADSKQVDFFVIDLRKNTGGNSSVAQPLINGLSQRPQFRGRLYMLIGRETFSSGMLNALELRARAGAIAVGESSGGKPNGYGEVKSFVLPNSQATVWYSTRYFQTVSGDPKAVEPDLPVAIRANDFFAKRDPAIEAIAPSP
jgi:hypothetical protein